jgi:class 3 adenylate cyclase
LPISVIRRAQEDDVEEAARTALALYAEAVPKFRTEQGAVLQIRVGIATGAVIVADVLALQLPP